MATDKQIQANRQNAQHSTGPASAAGREVVSQNATTHGLSGSFNFMFLSESDREEFDEMFANLVTDHQAASPSEVQLILKMAQSLWRSRRAVELQDQCIEIIDMEEEDRAAKARKNLDLYIRYQASHDRAYQRYAAELRKFQTDLKKAEIGFVSQQAREAKELRAQAQEVRRENAKIGITSTAPTRSNFKKRASNTNNYEIANSDAKFWRWKARKGVI